MSAPDMPAVTDQVLRFEVPIAVSSRIEMPGEIVQWLRVNGTRPEGISTDYVMEVWARVLVGQGPHVREMQVFGTGVPLPPETGSYVGTGIINGLTNGRFIGHVFDVGQVVEDIPSRW